LAGEPKRELADLRLDHAALNHVRNIGLELFFGLDRSTVEQFAAEPASPVLAALCVEPVGREAPGAGAEQPVGGQQRRFQPAPFGRAAFHLGESPFRIAANPGVGPI
jgi:hypothetical protein